MIKSEKYHDRESERNKRNIKLEEKKTKLTTKGDITNPNDGSFYVKNQGGENYDLNIKMDNKWRTVPLTTTTSGIRTSEQIQTGGASSNIISSGTTDTTEIELGLASLRDELEVEKNKLSNTNSDIASHTTSISTINTNLTNKEDKIVVYDSLPTTTTGYEGQTIGVRDTTTKDITEYYVHKTSQAESAVSSWKQKVSGATNLDGLSDVDTSTLAPTKNDVLKWNGSTWVPKVYNYSFTFGIASFSCNVGVSGSSFLVGVANVNHINIGGASFSASYINGPATGGYITHTGWSNLTLGNSYIGPTTNTTPITYPSVGGSRTFTLNATDGSSPTTSSITYYYYNKVYYGISLNATYTENNIEALSDNIISNNKNRTITLNASSGNYIVYAYPSRLGTVTFMVGGFEGGFNSPINLSITNANGYTENYYVYRSTNSGLGNTTIIIT